MRDISDSVTWKPIETTVIAEQRTGWPHNRNLGKKADVREGKRKIWKSGQQGSHSEYCPLTPLPWYTAAEGQEEKEGAV